MSTSRAAMTYATALNRNSLPSNRGLQLDIPTVLDPDEEVLLVLPGVAGDFPDVMIASATRFLLAAVAGPLKRAKVKKQVAASEVTGVEYSPGVLSRVKVVTSSGSIKMMPHAKADAARFAEEFSHLIRTGRLPG